MTIKKHTLYIQASGITSEAAIQSAKDLVDSGLLVHPQINAVGHMDSPIEGDTNICVEVTSCKERMRLIGVPKLANIIFPCQTGELDTTDSIKQSVKDLLRLNTQFSHIESIDLINSQPNVSDTYRLTVRR